MRMKPIIVLAILLVGAVALPAGLARANNPLDPLDLIDAFGRFPFARVIPLDNGNAWGLIYADV